MWDDRLSLMISHHRGYEIDVWREKCLGGWLMLYYTVVREEDGWFALDGFEDSAETVRDKIKQFKDRVDVELESDDPWDQKLEDFFERKRAAELALQAIETSRVIRERDEKVARILRAAFARIEPVELEDYVQLLHELGDDLNIRERDRG